MSNIFIVPVAAADANRNFRLTVNGGGPDYYWGLRGSKGCARKWHQAVVGDYLVFKGALQYFVSARIKAKVHDPALAKRLWGIDQRGFHWEFIFGLSKPTPLDIRVSDYASVLGARVGGFDRVAYRRLGEAFAAFGRERFLRSFGIEESFHFVPEE